MQGGFETCQAGPRDPSLRRGGVVLRLAEVGRTYPEGDRLHKVLDGVDLHVAPGETVALTGASGSGKSTLLNLIAGIDLPDAGEIRFDGQVITSLGDRERTLLRRRRMGFVFQFFNLLPTLSVLDNIILPQRLNGIPRATAVAEARRLLERVDLAGREGSHADRLSGGEQQRVALLRAVAHGPALVLADEPTGNLDEITGQRTLALLLELTRERNAALVMVTHARAAARQCDRTLTLSGGRLTGSLT